MTINILGIDPGPIPGIATLHYLSHPGWKLEAVHPYQCDAAGAPGLLAELLDEYGDHWAASGIEAYVTGNIKSRRGHGGLTAAQIPVLTAVAAARGVRLRTAPAGTVKPWAECSDSKRMKISGIWAAIPARMRHARSASQVALYWAVRAGGVPDPLSRKAQADA